MLDQVVELRHEVFGQFLENAIQDSSRDPSESLTWNCHILCPTYSNLSFDHVDALKENAAVLCTLTGRWANATAIATERTAGCEP